MRLFVFALKFSKTSGDKTFRDFCCAINERRFTSGRPTFSNINIVGLRENFRECFNSLKVRYEGATT